MREMRQDHIYDPETGECEPLPGYAPFGQCWCGTALILTDGGRYTRCPKGHRDPHRSGSSA